MPQGYINTIGREARGNDLHTGLGEGRVQTRKAGVCHAVLEREKWEVQCPQAPCSSAP